MSAPSPRPSAFLGIGNNLLGEQHIAFCALTVTIVKNDWFSKTWRLGKPHIAWDHALKYLRSEESAQIRGNLAGERSSFIVHGEQDAFDLKARIQGTADAHQRIQQFGNAFERQVLALNGHQNGVRGYEGIQGEKIQGWRAI